MAELVWVYKGFGHKLCAEVQHERLITANGTLEPSVQRLPIADGDLHLQLSELCRLYPCTAQLPENVVEKKATANDPN